MLIKTIAGVEIPNLLSADSSSYLWENPIENKLCTEQLFYCKCVTSFTGGLINDVILGGGGVVSKSVTVFDDRKGGGRQIQALLTVGATSG